MTIAFVAGRTYWGSLLSLAFLLLHKPAAARVFVTLVTDGWTTARAAAYRQALGFLRDRGDIEYFELSQSKYTDAIPTALAAADVEPYVGLCLDDVVAGPGAWEFLQDAYDKFNTTPVRFGALTAHWCLVDREFCVRGQRVAAPYQMSLPRENYFEGLTLFNAAALRSAGLQFEAEVGADTLGGHPWVEKLAAAGFEIGIPSHPVVIMQRLSKQPVTNARDENVVRTHRTTNNREVQVPGFMLDDYRLRCDENWESQSVLRHLEDLEQHLGVAADILRAAALKIQPPPEPVLTVTPTTPLDLPKAVPAGSRLRLGAALFACSRWYETALTLAYYFAYCPDSVEVHAFVDLPRNGDSPARLRYLINTLVEAGYIKSALFHTQNVGLMQNITAGISQLALSGRYEYVQRLEDDILIGPQALAQMLDCMDLSTQDERPIGILSCIVSAKHSGLRPIRFRNIAGGRYLVGIAGHNQLEPGCILRTDMGLQGFTWSLDDPKGYNTKWLNKARACGYEGASIITPTLKCTHIGYSTTVPNGTPVAPSCEFYTGRPIVMPSFEFQRFRGDSPSGQAAYCRQVIREISLNLPSELSGILLRTFMLRAAETAA